jgi:uncharacterized membrane protein (DUF485 family)
MSLSDNSDAHLLRIAEDPRYIALVRKRSRMGWRMSAIILLIFFGYTLLVAFAGPFLGTPLGSMTTTIGMPIGIFVIASAIILTGVYVRVANSQYDAAMDAIVKDHSA